MKKLYLILLASLTILFMFSSDLSATENTINSSINNTKINNLRTISKIDFVMMIHNELGLNIRYFVAPDIEKIFKDVKNEDKYSSQLYDLVTTGIVDDKEIFEPNKNILKIEALHYLNRAYNYECDTKQVITQSGNKNAKYNKFMDITRGKVLGLFEKKDNRFGPKDYLTKKDASLIIEKLKKIINSIGQQDKKVNSNVVVKPTYKQTANSLEMKAKLINNSKTPLTITFNTGEQCRFILIDGNGKEIYNSSNEMMFDQLVTKITLKPGESKEFAKLLTFDNYKDIIENAVVLKVIIPGYLENGTKITEQTVRFVRFLGPPAKKTVNTIVVSASAKLNKNTIQISYSLTNTSENNVNFYYQNGKLADFVLLDENRNELFRWSDGKMFSTVMLTLNLNKGEQKEFTQTIINENDNELFRKARFVKVEILTNLDSIKFDSPKIVEIKG